VEIDLFKSRIENIGDEQKLMRFIEYKELQRKRQRKGESYIQDEQIRKIKNIDIGF
jgi:hypothetical protein